MPVTIVADPNWLLSIRTDASRYHLGKQFLSIWIGEHFVKILNLLPRLIVHIIALFGFNRGSFLPFPRNVSLGLGTIGADHAISSLSLVHRSDRRGRCSCFVSSRRFSGH